VGLYIHSPIRLHGVVLNKLSTGTTLPSLNIFVAFRISMISNSEEAKFQTSEVLIIFYTQNLTNFSP
jgi:hypothetical protein